MEKNISLILKPGKEKPVKNFHHWIFSGAVKSLSSEARDGDIVSVYSAENELLGHAYINRASAIVARMIAWGESEPMATVQKNIENAIRLRQSLFLGQSTNAYRLINAEGDGVPGLIVDVYNDRVAIQVATLGMEKLLPGVLEQLKRELHPVGIYEKSSLPVRREEGLKEREGVIEGDVPDRVEVLENGLKFLVDIPGGQKTGFFLDQREMRQLAKQYAKGKNVLNCFSYTGGFSIAALAGGATRATSVDISPEATVLAEENATLNGFNNHAAVAADVFEYLRQAKAGEYDFIILDPPAFVKRKNDVIAGCRGYKDINRLAFKLLPEKGLLLTSSCSHFVDEKLFQQVIFQAAREANRRVRIIGRHQMAPDHPVNLYHPEGEYLKSLLLYAE